MSLHLEDAILKLRDIEISSPYIFYGGIIFLLCYWWKSTQLNNPSGLPVIGRRWYEIGNGKARQRIRDDCLGVVRSCLQKVCDVPILVYYFSDLCLLSSSMEMRSISIRILDIA